MRRLRKARGLSVRALSVEVGILASGITKIEQGHRTVTVGEAQAIATALSAHLEQMLSGDPIAVEV